MKYLLEDRENRIRMLTEIDSWKGTPFRKGSRAKGESGGTDCLMLVRAIFGVFPQMSLGEIPAYDHDAPLHRPNSLLRDTLNNHPWLERLHDFDEDDRDKLAKYGRPMIGDIYGFRIGASLWHLGVSRGIGTEFVNCMMKGGVITSWLDDPSWCRRLLTIHRVLSQPKAA